MDAVKFLKEWRRMCAASNNNCVDCVAPCPACIDEMWDERIVNTISIIEKWSAEHPQKTRLDDLKEKYPYFDLRDDGYPAMLPRVFGYCGLDLSPAYCMRCDKKEYPSKACWDMPLEE